MPYDHEMDLAGIDRIHVYAIEQVEFAQQLIHSNVLEAQNYAKQAFRSPKFVDKFFSASGAGHITEELLLDIADELERNPKEFSTLCELSFSKRTPAQARPIVEQVAQCLRQHANLVAIRSHYQDLHAKAVEATQLGAFRVAEALVELNRKRDLCDSKRDDHLEANAERRRTSR